MAGFTSLALMGGSMLMSYLQNRNANKAPNAKQLAPGPTDTTVDTIKPPAPPIADPGQQQAAAGAAAVKVRKRAAAGSLLSNPQTPVSSTQPVKPRYARASLLGS